MKYFYFFTIYSLLPLKCCHSRPCLSSELHLWRVALGFFSLCLFHPVILLLGFGQREYYTCDWTIFASLGRCPSGSFPSSEGSAWWPELSAWVLSFDLQLSNGLEKEIAGLEISEGRRAQDCHDCLLVHEHHISSDSNLDTRNPEKGHRKAWH